MSYAFLFPKSMLTSKVDEAFADQYAALKAAGHPCAIINENKITGDSLVGHKVVYRGWMMDATTYGRLCDAIYAAGGHPFTSMLDYLSCHHLPNWYPYLKGLTPETAFFPKGCDIEAEITKLDWGWVFIKDYVKSNKSALGSVVSRPDQAPDIVAEMVKFRGHIEGGLCVRRFVPTNHELRFFVLNGKVHHHVHSFSDVSYVALAHDVAKLIPALFYSIDIAMSMDGAQVPVVVEIGDGQVSDIVGWTPEQFAKIWEE